MRTKHLWMLAAVLGAATLAAPARADIIDCTVRDLQDTSSVMWDTLTVNGTGTISVDTLRITGVITGADTKTSGFAIYIEDFGLAAQYRGVDVFTGGNDQFNNQSLARGDRVQVMGKWTEFGPGGTELVSLTGASFGPPLPITFIDHPGLPAPLTVTTGDIAERSAVGELYEGMFCKVNHAIRCTRITNLPTNSFQAVDNTVVTPLDTILVDYETLANPGATPPPVGSVMTLCQGIVDQRGLVTSGGRAYRIQVRDAGDCPLPTPPNLVTMYAVSNDSIRVIFDKPLDPVTATDPFKYSRNTGKGIDSASLQPDPNTGFNQVVVLGFGTTPSDLATPGEIESVTVTGVKSSLGVAMPTPQGRKFRGGVLTVAQVQTSSAPYSGLGGSDASQYNGQVVTLSGTVTAVFGTLAFMEDPAGGLRSGIKVFAFSTPIDEGDKVTYVATPTEFFDETEISGPIFERNHGPGVMPSAMVIPGTGLQALNDTTAAGGTREDYEHVLLRITNVGETTPDTLSFNEWVVSRNDDCWNAYPKCDDTLHIDNRGYSSYVFRPVVGQNFVSITGPLEISFNDAKLEPRHDSDYVLASTGVGSAPVAFALRNPVPNPVASGNGVEFSFTLPARGAPLLRLYDLRGRIVSTVASGRTLDPGPQSVRWNGTDSAGRKVGPGIYFAQLQLGNQVATTKVVVAN